MKPKHFSGVLAFSLFLVLVLSAHVQCSQPPFSVRDMVESPVSLQQNLAAQGMEPYREPRKPRGYIRVGPSGHYFQFEDGTPFVPIGHNEWTQRFETPAFSVESIDAYFRTISESGENVLRLIVDAPNLRVENPPGTFNPAMKRFMDLVVRMAEKHDIYLHVAMWPNVINVPHFISMGHSWQAHPYNKRNGGPAARFEDLFRDPEALKFQEGRIRFFVDNWGNSSHIFAWEIANEYDYDNDMWINRMAAYCREYERSKWGKSHLVTISVSRSSYGSSRNAQWSSPHIDFPTFHTYDLRALRRVKGRGVERLVNYTFAVPGFFREAREKSPSRPLFDSEIPGVPHGARAPAKKLPTRDLPLMEEWFLATGWAYLCSGAAGPGFRWASSPMFNVGGGPNALSVKMYQYQLATRRITDRVDWNRFEPVPYTGLAVRTGQGNDLRVLAVISRDRKRALAWVFDRYGATEPIRAQASFSGLHDGPHRVGYYDVRTGKTLDEQKHSGTAFTSTSPAFLGHTVIIVEPAGQ